MTERERGGGFPREITADLSVPRHDPSCDQPRQYQIIISLNIERAHLHSTFPFLGDQTLPPNCNVLLLIMDRALQTAQREGEKKPQLPTFDHVFLDFEI